MRKRSLKSAKLVVCVESDSKHGIIQTRSVFDNRTQRFWNTEQIKERGIEWFLSLADMKETLNWNLNGDESKYQFLWGIKTNRSYNGTAYVYA